MPPTWGQRGSEKQGEARKAYSSRSLGWLVVGTVAPSHAMIREMDATVLWYVCRAHVGYSVSCALTKTGKREAAAAAGRGSLGEGG